MPGVETKWASRVGSAASTTCPNGSRTRTALALQGRTHAEVQPRWFDEASELGLTIVRAAIGRQLSERAAVYAGYGWVPRTYGTGVRHEQRTWQQLSLSYPQVGRWLPSSRVRLEQRWLDPWADASHRLRVLTRGQRPVGSGRRWHVALYDEAMFTFDTTAMGPARGYDRNRLFGGIGLRLSPAVTAEWGYLWENSTVRGPGQRNDHVPVAALTITWPQRP